MKKVLFAGAAVLALALSAPASAGKLIMQGGGSTAMTSITATKNGVIGGVNSATLSAGGNVGLTAPANKLPNKTKLFGGGSTAMTDVLAKKGGKIQGTSNVVTGSTGGSASALLN
jgi:hypothetical protein